MNKACGEILPWYVSVGYGGFKIKRVPGGWGCISLVPPRTPSLCRDAVGSWKHLSFSWFRGDVNRKADRSGLGRHVPGWRASWRKEVCAGTQSWSPRASIAWATWRFGWFPMRQPLARPRYVPQTVLAVTHDCTGSAGGVCDLVFVPSWVVIDSSRHLSWIVRTRLSSLHCSFSNNKLV